jgi:zinc/manganese transport system permease protein
MFAILLQPSWNPIETLRLLFAYHFMQNAFLAGTCIALVAGPIGYLMVVRGQSFLGHAVSHIGFAGAAGAALIGVSPIAGLIVFGVVAGAGIEALGERRWRQPLEQDIAIGTMLAFSLSLGLLFIRLASSYAANIYAFLFGTILGISDRNVHAIMLTAAVALLLFGVIARPLLFASVDPVVAAARGVPVRLLAYLYLMLLAMAVAEAVQVVGVLLAYALLVTPAATAQQLTARPARAMGLSTVIAVLVVWIGLAVAYFSGYPVGFVITSLAFAGYLTALAWNEWGNRRLRRPAVLATSEVAR